MRVASVSFSVCVRHARSLLHFGRKVVSAEAVAFFAGHVRFLMLFWLARLPCKLENSPIQQNAAASQVAPEDIIITATHVVTAAHLANPESASSTGDRRCFSDHFPGCSLEPCAYRLLGGLGMYV